MRFMGSSCSALGGVLSYPRMIAKKSEKAYHYKCRGSSARRAGLREWGHS